MPVNVLRVLALDPDQALAHIGLCRIALRRRFFVRLLLDPLLQDHSPLLVFGLAVAVSAIRGGFGPGVLSMSLGIFGAVYFFPPVGHFLPIDPKYRATAAFQLLTFVAVGLILSWLGSELRRLRWQALGLAKQRNEILESITDGFVALDRNLRFVYLNQAASQLMGSPRPAVIGKKIWDGVPAWQGTLVESQLHDVSNHHRPVRFEYQPPSRIIPKQHSATAYAPTVSTSIGVTAAEAVSGAAGPQGGL
jgi:PAS domain-containing protein